MIEARLCRIVIGSINRHTYEVEEANEAREVDGNNLAERRKETGLTAQRRRAIIQLMNRFSVRRFCFRHLFAFFAVCMIAASSYVLFNVLDVDGSRFKERTQVCGFEAVLPDSSEEIKSPAAYTPAPSPGSLRSPLFTATAYRTLASRPMIPSTSSYRIVHTRNAIQSESASPTQGSEPAQRSA